MKAIVKKFVKEVGGKKVLVDWYTGETYLVTLVDEYGVINFFESTDYLNLFKTISRLDRKLCEVLGELYLSFENEVRNCVQEIINVHFSEEKIFFVGNLIDKKGNVYEVYSNQMSLGGRYQPTVTWGYSICRNNVEIGKCYSFEGKNSYKNFLELKEVIANVI